MVLPTYDLTYKCPRTYGGGSLEKRIPWVVDSCFRGARGRGCCGWIVGSLGYCTAYWYLNLIWINHQRWVVKFIPPFYAHRPIGFLNFMVSSTPRTVQDSTNPIIQWRLWIEMRLWFLRQSVVFVVGCSWRVGWRLLLFPFTELGDIICWCNQDRGDDQLLFFF
jgi:hypothetical protein